MPRRPKTLCRHPGCSAKIERSGFCERHKKDATGWYKTSTKSATERGYGAEWRRLREQVLIRDCGLCQPCLRQGRIEAATEVDHITSKANGGTDDMTNLQAISKRCHAAKTAAERQTPAPRQNFGEIG